MRILYIGATWPQSAASAAGVRTTQLLKGLNQLGHSVQFLSIKKENSYQTEEINRLGVPYQYLLPNRPELLDKYVKAVDCCILETSRIEEMFGHMVYEKNKDCRRVIDLQDLHSLRLARQRIIENGGSVEDAINAKIGNEAYYREIGGMLRSHYNISCSTREIEIVNRDFPAVNMQYIPFMYPDKLVDHNSVQYKPNSSKKDFVWLGNFSHPPNRDAVEYMINDIWPNVYLRLGVELHIYGAHSPDKRKYNVPGVVFKGPMQSLVTLSRYRVLLAPLRFGAGIKGKIVDGLLYGVPSVTTGIGAEGMEPFPGVVGNTRDQIIHGAVELYMDFERIKEYCDMGFDMIRERFVYSKNIEKLSRVISGKEENCIQHVLFSESFRSTYYFSKFIELKERIKENN